MRSTAFCRLANLFNGTDCGMLFQARTRRPMDHSAVTRISSARVVNRRSPGPILPRAARCVETAEMNPSALSRNTALPFRCTLRPCIVSHVPSSVHDIHDSAVAKRQVAVSAVSSQRKLVPLPACLAISVDDCPVSRERNSRSIRPPLLAHPGHHLAPVVEPRPATRYEAAGVCHVHLELLEASADVCHCNSPWFLPIEVGATLQCRETSIDVFDLKRFVAL